MGTDEKMSLSTLEIWNAPSETHFINALSALLGHSILILRL